MSGLLPALEHGIIKIKGTGPVWEPGSVHRSGREELESPRDSGFRGFWKRSYRCT